MGNKETPNNSDGKGLIMQQSKTLTRNQNHLRRMNHDTAKKIPLFSPKVPPQYDTGEIATPDVPLLQCKAIKTVLLYVIVDALCLSGEEEIWLSWELEQLFRGIENRKPVNIPLSARQELLKGNYTELLSKRREHGSVNQLEGGEGPTGVVYAKVTDWVDSIVETVEISYDMSTVEGLKFRVGLLKIFENLGVDNVKNPRGAAYLPADLKDRVLQK